MKVWIIEESTRENGLEEIIVNRAVSSKAKCLQYIKTLSRIKDKKANRVFTGSGYFVDIVGSSRVTCSHKTVF